MFIPKRIRHHCVALAYLFFIDESGQDQRNSPYEVLGALSVQDRDLWNLIVAAQKAEVEFFGRRYAGGGRELKGAKVLTAKVFRLAAQLPAFEPEDRRELARMCLESGATAGRNELTALAQAKIAFVREALLLCAQYRCNVFASITSRRAPRPESDFLRKDYAFLFERFYYFLEKPDEPLGLVVFDELEKSRSHLLIDQMSRYFQDTAPGRIRAARVIPEPFFVHSDLTTAIQLVDLLAYIIAWGVRVPGMTDPARPELAELAALVCSLQPPAAEVVKRGRTLRVDSFVVLNDLRPQPLRAPSAAAAGGERRKKRKGNAGTPAKPPIRVSRTVAQEST